MAWQNLKSREKDLISQDHFVRVLIERREQEKKARLNERHHHRRTYCITYQIKGRNLREIRGGLKLMLKFSHPIYISNVATAQASDPDNQIRRHSVKLLTMQLDQTEQSISLSYQLLHPLMAILIAERHDTVDDIVIVLLQSLDCLLPADASLGHHKLDVLRLKASVVDLFAIVFFFLHRFLLTLDGLTLVFGCVLVIGTLNLSLCGELLSSGCLGLRVEIFDLGFAEDAVIFKLTDNTLSRSVM